MACCVVCGSVEKLTVDHIYPKCFGGANHPANYQIMCVDHNHAKRNYIDYSFNYVDVITASLLIDYVHTTKFPFVSKTIKKHVLKKCFDKSMHSNELILARDWEFIVDYFKLYGMTLKLKPRVSELPYSLKE